MYFIFILYIILGWYFVCFLVHNILKSKKLICTFFTQVTVEGVTVQLYILFKIFMAILIVFEA
ncbi:hypothetical protein A6J85_09045 [Streptococcus gordonii]|uniref:Uncharacterized protein n=1 Tax=Streptococcus oralis subsp. oralis TaxID=1891914 RepID=A0A1X1I5B2_STROR|nr:hypothetical protein A6J85_09045 [Streptococcus gordonii]ORO68332.1 hypothetical protein B7715_00725 [Streptococcus oralis subsp. oralis]